MFRSIGNWFSKGKSSIELINTAGILLTVLQALVSARFLKLVIGHPIGVCIASIERTPIFHAILTFSIYPVSLSSITLSSCKWKSTLSDSFPLQHFYKTQVKQLVTAYDISLSGRWSVLWPLHTALGRLCKLKIHYLRPLSALRDG